MKLMRLPEIFELFLKEVFDFLQEVLPHCQIIFLGFNQILIIILFILYYLIKVLVFDVGFAMFIVYPNQDHHDDFDLE
jgi:hypothetical protein